MYNENEFEEIAQKFHEIAEELKDRYFLNSCMIIGGFTSSETKETHALSGKSGNTYEIIGMLDFMKHDILDGKYGLDED